MRKIPLCIPEIDEREIETVSDVIRSGWLAHGEMNKKLEENFAKYMGVKHAISMNSCASCLHLAVEAQGIKGEVILPSFTFVASANAVVKAGAVPVFADIEEDTYTIDPKEIEKLITDKTEAIMPVHFAGQCADMDSIMRIANKYNLKVIEDSAEDIGGEYNGKKAGTFGVGCYSLFATKNMTTGEGGLLTTNDDEIAEKVRTLLGHGIRKTTYDREGMKKAWYRSADMAGYNFRLSNVLAAMGTIQLDKLDDMNRKRQEVAGIYNDLLKDNKKIKIPFVRENSYHVYQMYTILLNESIDRDEFVTKLNENGIGASVHFAPSVHEMPVYKDSRRGSMAVTERVNNHIVTLPIYPRMAKEDVEYVVDNIEKFTK